ncbi:MAG: zinc ribbon domain-containing protein [Xanthomonadales bacterium]|nr:zinc ribbon domain-containing protein [Xanthomonadales bacterium]
MPIVEYRGPADCRHCGGGFEHWQGLKEPDLERCPRCGAAVRRVISAPAVRRGAGALLAERNLARHGFTQYRRIGRGVYEKTAGEGPPILRDER